MEFIEEVINITVTSGTATNTVKNNTDSDDTIIVGAVIYSDALTANPSMIKASIQVDGRDVSKMQHISNYRSREAAYREGYKPILNFDSGKEVRFQVYSESNFTTDFKAELVLIKIKKNC